MFELENLASKAYLQHDDRYREPIIVDRFIRGLGDNRIQSELCQMETIETIQDVFEKANQLEVGFQKCKQIIDYKNSRNNGAENKNNNQYKRTVALFCSHMLCHLCHQRLTELDSSSLCPMCRGVEVTNCLSLAIHLFIEGKLQYYFLQLQ
ncbi:hypothetical protein BpHYR1_051661 [Brachionus plicatilis]|uniref:RING-type domain-containing protein n=1 Tax=Brachionus plicatilis TaxID=10195 RepID=A0A3M7Q052_BRAPC|nr:hypothetical protein BpHYR1_051661 [Brachionus plicatilis]